MKQLVSYVTVLLVMVLGGGAAQAEEAWRIGLLVANNQGSGQRPPLRYAEQDADELGDVLVQLGGFRRSDVHVLKGRSLAHVQSTLAEIKKKLAQGRASGRRVVLLFFFSGHSDGQALELGRDRWAFADVRRGLLALGAEIRLAIIDSCRSGALLAEKGGKLGPTFDIRFTDDLATSGEAILTSSAAHEMALESREIRASFFSHHFVSGLRGAADSSGDGRVTLGEAYRYAFVNTLLATSNTLNGPQHPGYDFRLAGQGELVLTDLLTRGAKLSLPRGFDRIFIADQGRQHLFELTDISARRIAVPAGHYLVQGRKQGRTHRASVSVKEGETREVAAGELIATDRTDGFAKGEDPFVIAEARHPGDARGVGLAAGVAVTRGAADALPWLPAVRMEASFGRSAGWSLRLDLASGAATGFRESGAYFGAGYFRALHSGRFGLHARWLIVAGPVAQTIDGGERFWTTAAGTGPALDASLEIAGGVSVGVGAGIAGMLLRRDGVLDGALWPTGGATIQLRL
jgi:hypothetical protein